MSFSRLFARTRGLVVLSAMSVALALPALRPAEAVPGYDGVWSVVIITKEGICDPSYRYPIRITNGNLGNAGTATVNISGKVGKNGAVIVNVSAGDKTATGTGRLAGHSGGGILERRQWRMLRHLAGRTPRLRSHPARVTPQAARNTFLEMPGLGPGIAASKASCLAPPACPRENDPRPQHSRRG